MEKIWPKLFIMYEMRFSVSDSATYNILVFAQHYITDSANVVYEFNTSLFNIYELDRSVCVCSPFVQQWDAKQRENAI